MEKPIKRRTCGGIVYYATDEGQAKFDAWAETGAKELRERIADVFAKHLTNMPRLTEKQVQRLEIQQHIEEYLARGGQIIQVPPEASAIQRTAKKQTRRERINEMRRKDYQRNSGRQHPENMY